MIERAREVLKLHERTEHVVSGELVEAEDHGPVQIQLFEPVGYGIAERIRSLNLDELRPIEALQLLQRIAEGVEAIMRVAGVMSGTSLDGIDVAIVGDSRSGQQRSRPSGSLRRRIPPRCATAILGVSNCRRPTPPPSRA